MNKPKDYLFDRVMFAHERPEELSLGEVVQLMVATLSKPGGRDDIELLWEKEGQLRDLIRRGVLPAKAIGEESATSIFRTIRAMNVFCGKDTYPNWADPDSGMAISYSVSREDLMRLKDGLEGGPGFQAWLSSSISSANDLKDCPKQKRLAERGVRALVLDNWPAIKKRYYTRPDAELPTPRQVRDYIHDYVPSGREQLRSLKRFRHVMKELKDEGLIP